MYFIIARSVPCRKSKNPPGAAIEIPCRLGYNGKRKGDQAPDRADRAAHLAFIGRAITLGPFARGALPPVFKIEME